MFKEGDFDPEYMNSIDRWLDNEDNAKLHHDTITGLDDMPFLLAFEICCKWVEANNYRIIPAQQLEKLRHKEKSMSLIELCQNVVLLGQKTTRDAKEVPFA
jgi:hypothetical protein